MVLNLSKCILFELFNSTAQQTAPFFNGRSSPPQIASERLLLWGSILYTHVYYICSSFLTVIKFVVITSLYNFFNFLYFVLFIVLVYFTHKVNTVIIRVTVIRSVITLVVITVPTLCVIRTCDLT